jgi:hypothetical protein
MTKRNATKTARPAKLSVDARSVLESLAVRGPAYAEELVQVRGLCSGEKIDVLRACKDLERANLIDRSDEHEGRWLARLPAVR